MGLIVLVFYVLTILVMKNEVEELQISCCPFGYFDLKRACEIWDEVRLYESDLFEIIEEFKDSCGYSEFDKIDPVYCVLDHILQMARNKIVEIAGYDFLNDFSRNGTEIYTYWNYMCSSYDYSDKAIEELKEKIEINFEELNKDQFCHYFFKELEIGAE